VASDTIQDAAQREWKFLTDENKSDLLLFCINIVLNHSVPTEAYVQAKLSSVAAKLFKRGCMEFSLAWKEAFFVEIKHSVVGNRGVEAQVSGLKFLVSMISEFSLSTSSSMGLSGEFHRQCKDLFEVEYLKSLYCWAKDAAMMVTNNVKEYNAFTIEEKVCIEALEVMFQIMNWDFKVIESCRSSTNIRNKLDLKNFDHSVVQPGLAWYDVLISCGHIAWLLDFYGTLRKRFKDDDFWLGNLLASSCRQLIVQLCSLTGTIFLSDNLLSYTEYIRQMLYSIVEWINPPDVIIDAINSGKCASEMLDGCRALLSIATLIDTETFNSLLRPFGTLQLMSNLTLKVAFAFGNINNDEQSCISEAMDILLETWSILLMNTYSSGKGLSNEEKNICASLFNYLMDSQLKAASVLIFKSENESGHFLASVSSRDERLGSICLIARAAADITLPFLFTSFSERLKGLCQIKKQNDRNSTLEELYWLILMSGHVLTDSGEGETILM